MFKTRNILLLASVALGLALGARPNSAEAAQDQKPALAALAERDVDFERDIQPIFVQQCNGCHGPDKMQNGLRLDRKEQAMLGGDSGIAIQPGNSEGSRLIQYVSGMGEIVMPPKGKWLSGEQVGLLRAWIDQGAVWPDSEGGEDLIPEGSREHWALIPPRRPDVPEVKNTSWVQNPIDAFVLAHLESRGIEPSPPASRQTLIRRLSLDLLGLIPGVEETKEFVEDERPYANQRLAARLLSSPHHGERWARHWLDLARYADSDGYEKDTPRPNAWRYREWVINAINRDLPYDQFVIEQLAGDLLPNPTIEQLTATGFHRNTLTNKEGGVDAEEFRVAAVVDRTNTTATAFLGLTMACAQCHSHKYDPITQREYFGLYAFFDSGLEKDIPAPLIGETAAYEAALGRYNSEDRKLKGEIQKYMAAFTAKQRNWEKRLDVPAEDPWTPLQPYRFQSPGGASFQLEADGALRVQSENPGGDVYVIGAKCDLPEITGLKIEIEIHDPSANPKTPQRKTVPYALSELSLWTMAIDDPATSSPLDVAFGTADVAFSGDPAGGAIDGRANTRWTVAANGKKKRTATAFFATEDTVRLESGQALRIQMNQSFGARKASGRIRLWATAIDPALLRQPPSVLEALRHPAKKRAKDQKQTVIEHYKTLDPRMREFTAAVQGLERVKPAPPATQAQTLVENPEAPQTRIHTRGDFMRPGDPVSPHTPAALGPFKARNGKPDRLDLARWIADLENPLTARVEVNRVWRNLFGTGLVETVEDFGTRGEAPSHPELLDWLAVEFASRGWSVKDLIKLIVQSNTYRQSSRVRTELLSTDPYNRLLARQNRFRVESEITRDLFLDASGLLCRKIGGKSVQPPLAAGIASLGYANSGKWTESKGEDRYRRGLYTFFRRTVPYPMLMIFDSPDSNVSCARRTRSNTPLQALTLLNDPVFVECAQSLGRRIIDEGPEKPAGRIRYAFQLCLARDPSAEELAIVTDLLRSQRERFESDTESAIALAGADGEAPENAEEAAWTAVGRILMNLDEFVTRE